MNTGLKPVWAGRNMRLDPFRLPQMVSYATRDDYGDVTFTIDQRGAVIRRMLEMSGLPAIIALPPNAFRGVAARVSSPAAGPAISALGSSSAARRSSRGSSWSPLSPLTRREGLLYKRLQRHPQRPSDQP